MILRESITGAAILAIAVALVGLVVLAGTGGGGGSAAGDLLVAGGVLSASFYTIVAKRFDDGPDAAALTTWQFTVAALVATILALVARGAGSESPPVSVAPDGVGAVLVGASVLYFTIADRREAAAESRVSASHSAPASERT